MEESEESFCPSNNSSGSSTLTIQSFSISEGDTISEQTELKTKLFKSKRDIFILIGLSLIVFSVTCCESIIAPFFSIEVCESQNKQYQ